jgi:hypothetical protein
VFFILLVAGVVASFVGTFIIALASPAAGGFFFLIAVLATLVIAITCTAVMPRWWTLQFNVLGMVSCTGRKRRGVDRRAVFHWREITWIGPCTQEYFTYLGVRSTAITGGPGLPVPVCPLATSDFPVAALREAIMRFHPGVNLDAQLQRS